LDSYLFKSSSRKIIELYKTKGYPSCKVDKSADLADAGYLLSMRITEGPHVTVKKVKFEGRKSFSAARLRKVIKTKKALPVIGGGIFDEEMIKRDALALKKFYIDNGFLDATVEPTLIFNQQRTRLSVIFTIIEGPRYKVGEIEVRGNRIFTGREIRKVLRVKSGDNYIIGRIVGGAGDEGRIKDLYGETGYILADVRVKTMYAEAAPVVNVTYEIEEGRKIYVGKITIKGNFKTKDKVVRRNLLLNPGDVFNIKELRDSRMSLYNKRFFDKVDIGISDGERPDVKDITIALTEGRTGNIILGAGITSNSGLVGNIAFTQRNFDIADFPKSWKDFISGNSFVGAGQVLRLRIQPGTELSRYSLYFREPYLFDKPVSFGLNLFKRDRIFSNYDESRAGVVVSLGKRVKRHFSLEAALRVEEIEIDNIDFSAPSDLFEVEGSNDVYSLILTANWDKRDSFWLPSKGYQVVGRFEPAGGDFEFCKFTLAGSCHKTLKVDDLDRKHILSLSGKLGFAEAWGGSDKVPIFERFFAGGATTIRGFEYRGAGPHKRGYSLGGESTLLASAEYSFPLVEDSVRGILFFDSGAVYYETGDFDLSDIRASIGFGLRLYMPFFGPIPLSFDWGFPVASEKGDEKETFSFSIGYMR